MNPVVRVVAAVVAWLVPVAILLAVAPAVKARFATFGLLVPTATRYTFDVSSFLFDQPVLAVVAGVALLATVVLGSLLVAAAPSSARKRWWWVLAVLLPLGVSAQMAVSMGLPEYRLWKALSR